MTQAHALRLLHWLSFLAILALPLLPISYLVVRHGQGAQALFPPGPLAPAHAGLDCKDCHVEPWRGWHQVLGESPLTGASMDRACAQCHGGLLDERAANCRLGFGHGWVVRPQLVAPHHPRQVPREVGPCADCHQEHQGEKGLRSVSHDSCLRCHRDLRTVDGRHTFYPHLTEFDTDHPPFGWWRGSELQDPGQLHFNHQLHLCLDGKALRGISDAVDRLKKLECGFCHQPDVRGGRMAPVRYDKHCAECHPLAVQLVTQTNDDRTQLAAKSFGQEPAPHAAPELVLAVLRERLRGLAPQMTMIGMDGRMPESRRRPPGPQVAPFVPLAPPGWVDSQASVLQRLLFEAPGGCRYCHIDRKEGSHPCGLPEYAPTNIPASWFPHAKFSHARHGLMPCSACHENATTSRRTADVLMPLRAKCLECHHNRKDSRMRARADCLECHPYHGPVSGMPVGTIGAVSPFSLLGGVEP